MKHKKARAIYLATFIAFLIIEVLIGLYVHDSFVRPYLGDVLVVVLIYCFVRTIIPIGIKPLPLYIFLFALGVEILQLVNIVSVLGIPKGSFLAIIIGSTFSFVDIICYFIGCLLSTISYLIPIKE